MVEHHKQSIDNLLRYFKDQTGVIAVILGGSIAKGCERPDSDIDAIIVVTEERYAEQERMNRLSECIYGYCTYEEGYFDIKYCTESYLTALSQRGSEPSRNAFLSSRCLYTTKPELTAVIEQIPVFQKQEKADKMLSFYSALRLSAGYFWKVSGDNPYLRTKVVADIVLFGLRLLLQSEEVLFPCHKSLLQTVAQLERKPENLLELTNGFLTRPSKETKAAFVDAVINASAYQPPETYAQVLTRFVDDNELWWYKERPVIAEW